VLVAVPLYVDHLSLLHLISPHLPIMCTRYALSRDHHADEETAESIAAGLSLLDCGNNLFCCNACSDATCCSTQDQHFFVDLDTGDVKDPSKASATTSGTW
jgi:hypothetical protein